MVDKVLLANFVRVHTDPVKRGYVQWNCQRYVHTMTPATRRATSYLCNELADLGLWFALEVPVKGIPRRADIIVPELYESQVIEIHDSEGAESLAAKKEDYRRRGIAMVAVAANNPQAGWEAIRRLNKLALSKEEKA